MPHPPHPLASTSQLILTPSAKDGIPSNLERDLRVVGCQLIQEAGVLLDLPQSTMATAQVLLQRFFYVSSMLSFTINEISIAALYLSSKLCESPIRIRDLLNIYTLLTSRNTHLLNSTNNALDRESKRIKGKQCDGWEWEPPSFHDQVFYELKDGLVISEIQILKRLGFNMQVDLPYSHMVNYCKILDLVNRPNVVQRCWGILNDALQTPLYTIHPPHVLACFSILLATRLLRIPLPDQWWILFDGEYSDIWACCGTVMRLWDDWKVGGRDWWDEMREVEGEEEEGDVVEEEEEEKKVRWERAWKLAGSRRYVRRWLEKEKEMVGF